jgi:hypothetical protein
MVKLNKNQQKFFEEAIKFYGEDSRDVRFKSLKEFADSNGLIIPVSALKNYCQEEGQIRGHYNLTLVGIEPSIKETEHPDFSDINESLIEEKSAYVSVPKKRTSKRTINVTGMKPIKWENPVYLLLNDDLTTISIHYTLRGAYDNKWTILHSSCDIEWDDVEKIVKYTGKCIINSTNSSLWCAIIVMELKK